MHYFKIGIGSLKLLRLTFDYRNGNVLVLEGVRWQYFECLYQDRLLAGSVSVPQPSFGERWRLFNCCSILAVTLFQFGCCFKVYSSKVHASPRKNPKHHASWSHSLNSYQRGDFPLSFQRNNVTHSCLLIEYLCNMMALVSFHRLFSCTSSFENIAHTVRCKQSDSLPFLQLCRLYWGVQVGLSSSSKFFYSCYRHVSVLDGTCLTDLAWSGMFYIFETVSFLDHCIGSAQYIWCSSKRCEKFQ